MIGTPSLTETGSGFKAIALPKNETVMLLLMMTVVYKSRH
jgi:hypothetical protein